MRLARSTLLLLLAPLRTLAADPFIARVVHVADGDTITVEAPGHIIRVRLAGIDCPEKNQPSGAQATWFTNNLAMGRLVQVTDQDKDRYGRMVAEVVLPDGRDLNQELVKAGQA